MDIPTLPVLPDDVRDTLRSLGHPIRLFGENLANIRDRLKQVLIELKAQQKQQIDGASDLDNEDEEEEEEEEEEEVTKYTRASPELMAARTVIAKHSLECSQKRLERERQWRIAAGKRKRGLDLDDPIVSELNDIDSLARNAFQKFRELALAGSQYADSRAISSLCVLPSSSSDHFNTTTTLVVTGSWNAALKVWDTSPSNTSTGFRLREASAERTQCHTDRIMGLAASTAHNNSNMFCTTSLDTTAKLWKWKPDSNVEMATTDDTRTTTTTPNSTTTNSIQLITELKGHARRLCRSAFYPHTDQYIATTSFDHTWRLWDVATSTELLLQDGHGAPVYGLSFHPDGSILATTDYLGVIHLWDLRTSKSIRHFVGQHAKRVLQVQILPTGFQMASAGDDGSIRIWDLRRPKRAAVQIPAHSHLITQLCVDQECLLSSSFDGTVKVWNTRNWKLLNMLQGHDGKVSGVGVVRTPDSAGIVSCGFDKTLKLWG